MFDTKIVNLLRFLNETEASSFSEMQRVVSNPRTLSKKLMSLQENDLINKETGIYKLTEKGEVFFAALRAPLAILDQSESIYENIEAPFLLRVALQRYIRILQEEFQHSLASVVLFGSLAAGMFKETSDIDLFILTTEEVQIPSIFDRFVKCRRLFRQTAEYSNLIDNGLSFRVQHVPFSTQDIGRFHNIFPDIVATGIVLCDIKGSYRQFCDSAIAAIKKRGLLRVQDIHGNCYWRSFKD